MLAAKRSAGVTPEVNLRIPLHAGDGAYMHGDPPWLETQGRRHQKSKTGITVAPQKGPLKLKNKQEKTSYQSESKRIDVIDHTHHSLVQAMTKGVGDCRDTTFEVHSKS